MKFRVVVGINYADGKGGEKRAEPGALVELDRLHVAVDHLLERGYIEPYEPKGRLT